MIQFYRLTHPSILDHAPGRPRDLTALGLPRGVLRDLVLRALFTGGSQTGMDLSHRLHLPFGGVMEALLDGVIKEKLVDLAGGGTYGRAYTDYLLTERGREHAREALERSGYVGPAPVPLAAYMDLIRRQLTEPPRVSRAQLCQAFSDLVLSEDLIDRLGPAVNSMRSLFLYGPPGNGKTSIAERMTRLLPGEIFVPYALCVDGQIVQVFDPTVHRKVDGITRDPYAEPEGAPALADTQELDLDEEEVTAAPGQTPMMEVPPLDERWALCHRPCITTGGELTLDALDLVWDTSTRTYQAPYQLKACKGLLLIDDFGRQKVHPRDLLNRWIVPLEKGVDFLTLRTGSKFEVPFELLTLFSTNIDPARIVDAAFLRRIRYKVEIKAPTPEAFLGIFEAEAARQGIPFDPEGFTHLYRTYYVGMGREPRACQPRDLLQLMADIARFNDVPPVMNRRLIEQACQTYFVHMEGDAPIPPGAPLPGPAL